MIFLSPIFLQHGRSDSYRVATLPNIRDDNKTADGMYKVYSEMQTTSAHNFYTIFILWVWICASPLDRDKGIRFSCSRSVFLSTSLLYLLYLSFAACLLSLPLC